VLRIKMIQLLDVVLLGGVALGADLAGDLLAARGKIADGVTQRDVQGGNARERRSRELFTVFADLSEQVFEFVDHGAGLGHETGQLLKVGFFKFQRLGVTPVHLGGMPVLGEFAGVLDEIHEPVSSRG
jgi:hypothetical protein